MNGGKKEKKNRKKVEKRSREEKKDKGKILTLANNLYRSAPAQDFVRKEMALMFVVSWVVFSQVHTTPI